MNRRKFILGVGTVAASGATVLGSGAFSSVEADRKITVETVDDSEAFLRLVPRGGSDRSSLDENDNLAFWLPGPKERLGITNPNKPEGLGADSVYRFAKDSAVDEPPLFEARNQGTQPVEIYGTPADADDEPTVRIFRTDTNDLLTEENPLDSPINVGEEIGLGLEVDTHGLDTDASYDTHVTIHAVAAEES